MELSAVLSLRDKLSATMNKAGKSVSAMTERVNEARSAISQISGSKGIQLNATSNISEVISVAKNKIGQLNKTISENQKVLSGQFFGEDFSAEKIDIELQKVSEYLDKNVGKVEEYNNKLAVLQQRQNEFKHTTSQSTRLGVEQQIDGLKNKLADIEAAKQVFAEWKQIRLNCNDLEKAQAEVGVLEDALRNINSTNVAVRAYIDWKNDALKQVYSIDDKLKSLGKRIISPVVKLKEHVSPTLTGVKEKLESIAGKVFSPVIGLKDKTQAMLPNIRSALGKIAGTVAYPIIKIKDAASPVVGKIASGIKSIAGKAWAVTLKILDKISGPVKAVGSALKNVTSKAWHATVAATDKVSSVIGGIKNKILNLKTLLGSLVIGGVVSKGLQQTVGSAMTLENQKVSMKHFIGTTNKGMSATKVQGTTDNYVSQLRKNANETPFDTGEVISAGSRAVAISSGNTKEAMQLVKLAEDMAATSGGTKSISDAIEALADAKMGEGERLKEFGFKVSADDFKKSGFSGVSKQLQSFFGGGSQELASTGAGLMSTITGSFSSALQDMGGNALELVKPQLAKIAGLLSNDSFMAPIIKKGSEFVSRIVGFGIKAVTFFMENWPKISAVMKSVWSQVQPVLNLFSKSFGGIGKIIAAAFAGKKVDASALLPSASSITPVIQAVVNQVMTFAPKLINGLIGGLAGLSTAIASQAPVILSAAATLLNILIQSISNNLPEFAQAAITIVLALANGIIQVLPVLIPAAINAITTIINALTANLPQIITAAMGIITTLANGLVASIPQLIPAAVGLILGLVSGLVEQLPALANVAIQVIMALANGILAALPALLQQAPVIISNLVTALITAIPMLINAAIQIIISLVQFLLSHIDLVVQGAIQIVLALAGGLIIAIPQLIAAIPQLVEAIISTIFSTNWVDVGIQIIKGIGNGLVEGVKSIGSSIKVASTGLVDKFKSMLGIHSPSRVMKAEVGVYTGEGVVVGAVEGIKKQRNLLTRSVSDLTGSMADAVIKPEITMDTPIPRKYPSSDDENGSGGIGTGGGYGNYTGLLAARPSTPSTPVYNSNSNQSSKHVTIQNLIGSVTVTGEADEDRLVKKVLTALADDIVETNDNMGEEVPE